MRRVVWYSQASRTSRAAAACMGWWSAAGPLWRTSSAPCCCRNHISARRRRPETCTAQRLRNSHSTRSPNHFYMRNSHLPTFHSAFAETSASICRSLQYTVYCMDTAWGNGPHIVFYFLFLISVFGVNVHQIRFGSSVSFILARTGSLWGAHN